ncbi:rsmC [Symbiodinium sp. CCMP2456]|nr:rsmC [Symbiodinium sp. CCMP2456]
MAKLNREITLAANTGSDTLQEVISTHAQSFNAINVATALHRLSRLHPSDNVARGPLVQSASLQVLLLRTVEVLRQTTTECDSKAVSTIAYSLAGLGVRDADVAKSVVEASLKRLSGFDRQGVANLTWALSKLPKVEKRASLARKLALLARDLVWHFLPQELCNVLWALCKLGVRDNKLMSLASEAVRGNLERFTPQGLSTLAAAFARAGVFVEALLDEIGEQAQARVMEFNVRDAAQLVWSHAKFKLCREPLLQQLCNRAASLVEGEGAEIVVSFLWSFGTLRWVPDKRFMKSLASRAIALVPKLGAHRSVRLLTALAKLAFHKSSQLTCLTESLQESLELLHPRMGAQEVGISAWALATLKPRGWKKLLGKLVSRASDDEVLPDLTWWSIAHLEFAIRAALQKAPNCKPLAAAPELLQLLTHRCEEQVEQIQEASRVFQDAPLVAAAACEPWGRFKCASGKTALVFGPGRHVRRSLQRSGFQVTQWYRYALGMKKAQAWPPSGVFDAAAMKYPDSYEAFEYALHAVAASLPLGAPTWVYGDVQEGVLSTTRAIKGLFKLLEIQEDGDARVVFLKRTNGQARACLESWFKEDTVTLATTARKWWSMPGLFAGGFVDVMSRFLLDTMEKVWNTESSERPGWSSSRQCKVLDFASGTGVLAAGLSSLLPGKNELWLIDADSVALQAASKNLPDAHTVLADGFKGVQTADKPLQPCHLIVSNPPVHQGHADDLRVLIELLEQAPHWLLKDGEMWLVTQEHIPTGRLFDMATGSHLKCEITTYATEDGRFVVWRATYQPASRKRKLETDTEWESATERSECLLFWRVRPVWAQGSEAPPEYELWVDFRAQRNVKLGELAATSLLQPPKVKEDLLNLAKGLQQKFDSIGVELPKGKLISGVMVDKQFVQEALHRQAIQLAADADSLAMEAADVSTSTDHCLQNLEELAERLKKIVLQGTNGTASDRQSLAAQAGHSARVSQHPISRMDHSSRRAVLMERIALAEKRRAAAEDEAKLARLETMNRLAEMHRNDHRRLGDASGSSMSSWKAEFEAFLGKQRAHADKLARETQNETTTKLAESLASATSAVEASTPDARKYMQTLLNLTRALAALEAVREMQVPVYTASKEVEGERLEGNAFFVCSAEDGMPIACLAPQQIRLSSQQPHAAEEVWGFAEESMSKAEREQKEAEEMKQYEAGLKDPSKYVMPPRKRMRELLGLPPEKKTVSKGQLLAKTLPPDALLWGRALMQRFKEKGGSVSYNLKVDRERKAACTRVRH